MTGQELGHEVSALIEMGRFGEALDALGRALPGEVELCEAQMIALATFMAQNGSSLADDCALFWALPVQPDVDEQGCITPTDEVRHYLHSSVLRTMTDFGVNLALGWSADLAGMVLPGSVGLELARLLAMERGVHHP